MKHFKTLILMFAFAALSTNLYAADSSSGCGLGWKVNGDNSFMGTITRGTTHAVLIPTFSMTAGTSGCAKHSIVKNDAKGKFFIEGNLANLMVEMSLGQGEVLAGFAEAMGCGSVESSFGTVMQENYGQIFTSDEVTPMEAYDRVKSQIMANHHLATSCQIS